MSQPTIPVAQRGTIHFEPVKYGETASGLPLEVFLPSGFMHRLVVAGLHGEENDGTFLLSRALRSIPSESLMAGVILAANPYGVLHSTRGNKDNDNGVKVKGVDLNRNFPTEGWEAGEDLHQWHNDGPKNVVLSTGSAGGPEPETHALLELVQAHHVREVISLHSPMNCVIDPGMTDLGAGIAQETGIEHTPAGDIDGVGTFPRWGEENGIAIMDYELPLASRTNLLETHYATVLRLITEGT